MEARLQRHKTLPLQRPIWQTPVLHDSASPTAWPHNHSAYKLIPILEAKFF